MSDEEQQSANAPEDDVEMGFFEHLAELRKRLMYSLYALVPAVFLTWAYSDQMMAYLQKPLLAAWEKSGQPTKLMYSSPMDIMTADLQISMITAVIICAPWIFYQVWLFIGPGLYRKERRVVLPLVVATAVFFCGGAFFGYSVVFPYVFEYLAGFNKGYAPAMMLTEYVSFSTRMLLAFGVAFELPVVTSLLAIMGIVNWKQLLSFGRWWAVIASVVAAVLTPPDPMSQILMLGPLLLLYALAVVVAYFVGPKVPKDGEPAADAPSEP